MKKDIKLLVNAGAADNFWSTKEVPELNIPSLYMNDGPHGVRGTKSADIIVTDNGKATCFPTSSALAATWNTNLIYEVGNAIGKEAKDHGMSVLLGPGINLKRTPLGGRNFEYYSEDPYLTSKMASGFVNGVQSNGVAACLKHYILNEQEVERMTINCIVDEYTLFNTYIRPFKDVIADSNPMMIMASYNKVNGNKAAESKLLLNDILREKLGFDGTIISDWGAVEKPVEALKAGVDFDMPYMGEYQTEEIIKAAQDDEQISDLLKERLERIENLVEKIDLSSNTKVDYEEHYYLARKAAEEAIVLLKNDKGILPLDINKNIGIIGKFFSSSRIQGAGSSKVSPYKKNDFYDALTSVYSGVNFEYLDVEQIKNKSNANQLIKEFALSHDVLICFTGLDEMDESEGVDRKSVRLSQHENDLINRLYEANSDVIVVMNNGTAVDFDKMADVKTLVEVWLCGEAMGEAFWNIMFGKVNPSGKLSETFPSAIGEAEHNNRLKINPKEVMYSEGSLVGYKLYDFYNMEVNFPFGYGLSYSEFAIDNFKIESVEAGYCITFDIENLSGIEGAEVVQIYTGELEQNFKTPVRQLAAFKKIFLKGHEKKTEQIVVPYNRFEKYNVVIKDYCIEDVTIKISAGTSSRDILYEEVINVQSNLTYEVKMLDLLSEQSICRDFYENKNVHDKFLEIFSYLKEKELFDIILDMPLNLIVRLFPDLIASEKINELLDYVKEQRLKVRSTII